MQRCMRQSCVWLSLVTLLLCARLAQAQCESRLLETCELPGVDGYIRSVIHWDPDGAGPLPNWLVVGGEFEFAGGIAARNIAAWDGARWHAFGAGVSCEVLELAVLKTGELLAGSGGIASGCGQPNGVRIWNGTAWEHLHSTLGGEVNSMLVLPNGDLLVGGSQRLYRWDGESVAELADLPGGTSLNGRVYDLATEADGKLLAVGTFSGTNIFTGQFHQVARWDGRMWSPVLGPGQTFSNFGRVNVVRAMPGGEIYIAGQFTINNGPTNIAVWRHGAWQALAGPNPQYVTDLQVESPSSLIGSGIFRRQDGTRFEALAHWNGVEWTEFEGFGSNGVTRIKKGVDGALIVAGSFFSAGRKPAMGLAFWSQRAWSSTSPRGFSGYVVAMMELADGSLAVAGGLSESSGAPGNGVARWDGEKWTRFGDGVEGFVRAIAQTAEGDLVAIGTLESAGGAPANGVARWNGTQWSAMGTAQMSGAQTLKLTGGGQLVAAGNFGSGSTPGSFLVARAWDGSEWQTIGEANEAATASVVLPNERLVVGGRFSSFEGIAASVVEWNGSAWTAFGSLPNRPSGHVLDILVMGDGSVVVAARDGQNDVGFHRWNGVLWTRIGGLTNIESLVLARSPDGGFYVSPLTVQVMQPFWWTGTQWAPAPFRGRATAVLARLNGNHWIAGWVQRQADGPLLPFEEYGAPLPIVLRGPESKTVCVGEEPQLSVVAVGADPLSYRWRLDGAVLDESIYPSASTATLSIVADASTLGREFDCVISNSCGSTISPMATIDVQGPDFGCPRGCPGDFNTDGALDLADLIAFFAEWQPCVGTVVPIGTMGDYDWDGRADLSDFVLFLSEWQPAIGQPCP